MPTASPPSSRRRILLLTFDAFNTIYQPRAPVFDLYVQAAQSRQLPHAQYLTSSTLGAAFKSTFKAQTKAYPNYGRDLAIRGEYGGARQWWEEIVRGTFTKALSEARTGVHDAKTETNTNAGEIQIPEDFVERLQKLFASREGYAFYPGAEKLFEYLRRVKRQGTGPGPFDRVIVGVVSNSDDRVPAVLKSLGLRVGKVRADEDVESMRLPGFEERGGGIARDLEEVEEVEEGSSVYEDVDFVVTSYEAGVEKPHRKIYDIARRQAERIVGQEKGPDWTMVHVGDDLEKDYRGCLDAGWRGYLGLDGRSLDELEEVPGTDVFGSLDELERKLGEFEV